MAVAVAGGGLVPCRCRARRLLWARLDPAAGRPCCTRACCLSPLAAISCTRAEVGALRAIALRQDTRCPRCGEPVARHCRGFECVDRVTRALRYLRAGHPRH